MPLILGTNSIKDTGYDVANSLRFNVGSTDHLDRSQSTGNQRTYTVSFWIKRSSQGGQEYIVSARYGNQTRYQYIRWNGDNDANRDKLDIFSGLYSTSSTSTSMAFLTNRKFRDVSAWYHIVLAVDTTQGTESNRVKIYVNGVQETSFTTATYPSQNQQHFFNINTTPNEIGAQNSSSTLGSYLSEVVLIDGSQLAADQFGEFDSDSGIWKPIDVSGLTFGTNGFYLEFKESGTSANSSGLGADTSGNTHHFTVSNLTATDQSTDTCTNNFATMNPLDNYYASNTYSEGNIKFVTKASGGFAYGTSTVGLSSGKWYAEFDCIATTDSGAYHQVGIVEKPSASTTDDATANIGSTAYSWGYFALDGKSRNNGSYSTYGASWTTGDIIGIYLNLDDNELRFSKNGAIQNSGTAISITAPASNGTGHYFITAGGMSTNASVTFEANFGNPFQSQSSSVSDANGYGAFEYSPTLSGVNYYALNTKNLAEFGG